MNKKKIATATALAGLVLWTMAPFKQPRTNRVLANAFPAKLLASPSSCTTPDWPVEARRYEVEGITLLHFHINADGQIEDAKVAASSSTGSGVGTISPHNQISQTIAVHITCG